MDHEVNEYPRLVESKVRPCGFEAIQLGVQSANSGTILLMKTSYSAVQKQFSFNAVRYVQYITFLVIVNFYLTRSFWPNGKHFSENIT